MFPFYSIGIYFSSALVRLCTYHIRCCMSLKSVIPLTAEAVIEDLARYSCMHTSIFL